MRDGVVVVFRVFGVNRDDDVVAQVASARQGGFGNLLREGSRLGEGRFVEVMRKTIGVGDGLNVHARRAVRAEDFLDHAFRVQVARGPLDDLDHDLVAGPRALG
ncbi:MAG: hypothetical protein FJ272_23275, partial [Planctomycetes bacterium]|nr:hypothetical protein [Planctomycetota bacterium]